jgi:hypothetical protein
LHIGIFGVLGLNEFDSHILNGPHSFPQAASFIFADHASGGGRLTDDLPAFPDSRGYGLGGGCLHTDIYGRLLEYLSKYLFYFLY